MEEPKLLREVHLCKGRRVSLYQRIYCYKNREFVRDVVKFGEAVAIIPFINDKEIIMLRQFRAPIGKWIYEIPAGKIEPGEDIYETTRRELVEETGYYPEHIEKLLSVYPTPGYSDEIIHIVLARKLKFVGARPEVGELIEIKIMSLEDAIRLVLSQEVVDSKTLIALTVYYLKHVLRDATYVHVTS